MELPLARNISLSRYPHNNLRSKFPFLSQNAFNLLQRLLTLDPSARITAKEALSHPYFRYLKNLISSEYPAPQVPSNFDDLLENDKSKEI